MNGTTIDPNPTGMNNLVLSTKSTLILVTIAIIVILITFFVTKKHKRGLKCQKQTI